MKEISTAFFSDGDGERKKESGKEGRKEGWKEGRKEGRNEGRKKGRKERRNEGTKERRNEGTSWLTVLTELFPRSGRRPVNDVRHVLLR